jgi:hypothetical protein
VNTSLKLHVLILKEVSSNLLFHCIIIQSFPFLVDYSWSHPRYLQVKSTRILRAKSSFLSRIELHVIPTICSERTFFLLLELPLGRSLVGVLVEVTTGRDEGGSIVGVWDTLVELLGVIGGVHLILVSLILLELLLLLVHPLILLLLLLVLISYLLLLLLLELLVTKPRLCTLGSHPALRTSKVVGLLPRVLLFLAWELEVIVHLN